jgi:hypothetical protein
MSLLYLWLTRVTTANQMAAFSQHPKASSVSDESVASLFDKGGGDNGQPDGSVLELYEEISRLRANPLGLDMYSRKEKVSIGILDILKDMNAPLPPCIFTNTELDG